MSRGSTPVARKTALAAGAVAVMAAVIGAAPAADAQVLSRFALRGEAGGGTMISSHQQNDLGYGPAIQASVRLGFTIIDPLVIQVSLANWTRPVKKKP